MEWLAKLVATPIIGAILNPLVNAYLTSQKQKLDAAGSHEARATEIAQKALDVDKREAELNAQILIAEQGNFITRSVRPVWAFPFILFTWKVIVWDKILGWGVTDPLDPRMWGVFMLMVGAYYGGRSIEKAASSIAGALGKRK